MKALATLPRRFAQGCTKVNSADPRHFSKILRGTARKSDIGRIFGANRTYSSSGRPLHRGNGKRSSLKHIKDTGEPSVNLHVREGADVSETANNEMGDREELKAKRNLLFKLFLTNPMHTRLAVEIKVIDDQIAKFAHQRERN